MAKMLPAHIDVSTISNAERRMFDLFRNDPVTDEWVVLHSLGLASRGSKPYGEIDFVVLIPGEGIFCLEVKGGRVACQNGQWETTDRNGKTTKLKRSPFIQAREGMFALLDSISKRLGPDVTKGFAYGYAVVMPDIDFEMEAPEWHSSEVIDNRALKRPISSALTTLARERQKFNRPAGKGTRPEIIRELQQVLRPDFEIIMTRGVQVEETEVRLLRLTEEQFAMLDLLVDNERCLFEGAAGTGKTMLALEYAKRSAALGYKTLFVCFNRLLGDWFQKAASETVHSENLHAGSYFRKLRTSIMGSSLAEEFIRRENAGLTTDLFEKDYPSFGERAIKELKEAYDVIVIDEAQDLLRPEILRILDLWLKGGLLKGRWAIFGDFHRQAIYGSQSGDVMKENLNIYCSPDKYTKGRLKVNCRNTRNIGEETALLSGFASPPYKLGQLPGLVVDYGYYASVDDQSTIIGDKIRRLLAEGVNAADIVILSSSRIENSAISRVKCGTDFCIPATGKITLESPEIKYFTIQAFKGMESPVVIVCDVEQVSEQEPQSMLYIAMSRARSQLTMLVHEKAKPSISECVRRKLQEGWNRS